MTQSFLQSAREQLSARYRSTPIPAFLAWWGDELSSLVPEQLAGRMMPPKPELWILPAATGGGDLRIVKPGSDQVQAIDVFGAGENVEILSNRWNDILAEFTEGQPEIRLCLAPEHYLALPVELPAAVENNLEQALIYQLDQLSPFRADQVYFDQRVHQPNPGDANARSGKRSQIQVELRLVPKAQLTPLLERLQALGIAVHAVDTLSAAPEAQPEGFNLLPAAQRAIYVHERARFNGWLALGLVALLALVMVQSLWLRQNTADQLQVEADQLRVEARAVAELRQELEQSLLAANFLSDRRAAFPAAIELLAEITTIMPNDIWLQRLQMRGDQVIVQGLTEGSQRVIEIMNESPLLDSPGFERAISIDQASGQENFTTAATLLPFSMVELPEPVPVEPAEQDAANDDNPGSEEGI